MEDTGCKKDELAWAKEQLEKLKLELSEVRGHLSTTEHEKTTALGEVKTLQQLLLQAEETEVSVGVALLCVCVCVWHNMTGQVRQLYGLYKAARGGCTCTVSIT